MTMHICTNLIPLPFESPNRLGLYKPQIPVPLSVLCFSSSSGRQRSDRSIDIHHQFSTGTISEVSSSVKYVKNPENSDSILLFLKESGFSKTQLEQVVKRAPDVLSAKLDLTIKPKIKAFHDLGFAPTDVSEIISANPWILMNWSAKTINSTILAFKTVLGSNASVCKVFKTPGICFNSNLKNTMLCNVEYLKSCGIDTLQIDQFVCNCSTLSFTNPEKLKELVKMVDEIGIDRKSKTFLHAIEAIGSMSRETWDRKLEVFRSLGFSEDETMLIFRKAPYALASSERKIKEVTQTLLDTGNYDISALVKCPKMFFGSVANYIKPRLGVIEILESKNLLLKRPALTTICSLSSKNFFEKFVLPYSNEVGNQLAGVWKGQRYEDTPCSETKAKTNL